MPLIDTTQLDTFTLPGLRHPTQADARQGLETLERWQHRMAPGSATPMHRHACEEVVPVLAGYGICLVDGQRHGFGPNSTLNVPQDAVPPLINTSDQQLRWVAALGMAPVVVQDPSGATLALPWQR